MPSPTFTALAIAALFSPLVARAQISAPSLVEDELPAEEPRRSPRDEPVAHPGPASPLPGTDGHAAAPGSGAAGPAAPAPAGAPAPAAAGPTVPGLAISEEVKKLVRPIEPVRTSWAQLLEAWQVRRGAMREQDLARATAAREQILAGMSDLGIENLTAFASTQVREAERSLAAGLAEDALDHATFAVKLAPDSPDAHLARSRALFARSWTQPGPALGELAATFGAAVREPHTIRSFLGDIFSAALAALFTAAAATVLVLFVRRLRLFLHDFHHLPLIRSGAPIQASFLALVLLALPVLFRLGPMAAVLVGAASVWVYLSRAERVTLSAAILGLVALPTLGYGAARLTAWTGSLAEQVFELEHGGDGGERAARLAALPGDAQPAPLLMALGRHHKRRGDLDAALRWYEAAAAADSRSGEVLVDLGNVLFLKGDLEGAKAAYLNATDRAGTNVTTLAAAHYNLSKLYLRLSSLEQSQEARKKAQQEDPAFIERYGSDDDFRANRYLVDVGVPADQIAALASSDGSPQAVGDAVRARVAGALPLRIWPAAPLLLIGALWLGTLARRRLGPSRACERCGRPTCPRCDGATGALCGQCVNVFVKKGVVDARDRLRKEAQVRRHAQWSQVTTRILALVSGGAGHLYAGDAGRGFLFLLALLFVGFVVWFWRGIMPPPQPSPYASIGKLVVAVPLGIAVYALAVRDAFRRSRG